MRNIVYTQTRLHTRESTNEANKLANETGQSNEKEKKSRTEKKNKVLKSRKQFFIDGVCMFLLSMIVWCDRLFDETARTDIGLAIRIPCDCLASWKE